MVVRQELAVHIQQEFVKDRQVNGKNAMGAEDLGLRMSLARYVLL